MEQQILRVEELSKTFSKRVLWQVEKVHAVNRISFDIGAGTAFGVVGESGCGKTTTARCIAGLDRPTAGEVFFRGDAIGHLSSKAFTPYRSKLQMVFQDPLDSLNPRYTVRSTLREPLDIHTEMRRGDKERKLSEILELVGLRNEHLDRYPHQLSAGQQQRVGIARAIVCDPALVLLDEPTASLDISVRGRVLELLLDLQDRLGITYMLISHDLGTIRFVCYETAVMYLGAIVEVGSTIDLFKHPLHPYTRALIGARPRLHGRVARSERQVLVKGEVPSPINMPNGCLFHTRCPEVVSVCRTERPALIPFSDNRKVACHLCESAKEASARQTEIPHNEGQK